MANTESKINCDICRQPYSPECDYNQGRCPHHPPMINIQPKDTSRGHFLVSLLKSLVRIGAGSALVMGHVAWAGGLLIFAEVLGIVEELV